MRELKEYIRRIIVDLLTLEARAIVAKYRPNIILVTGSVGKTSSKDAVYAALAGSFFIRKSEKSFNSDIGVPLTILGVPNGLSNPVQWAKNLAEGLFLLFLNAPYPKWLVLEVGADRPGDITRALAWLSPTVVVATRFPSVPVHVEFYKSPEDVVKEELTPVSWLGNGGVLIVNADDARARSAPAPEGVKKILYGFNVDANVKGLRYRINSKNKMPTGLSFDITHKDERAHINLSGIIGRTHATAVLAGIATAVSVGIPLHDAAKAFVTHEPPLGRTRLVPGIRSTVIIDDSYNSSPVASEEALRTLSECPHAGRRIAVLADMLELGVYSVPEHRRIGELVPRCADVLVTVGVRARDIAKSAREAGMPAEAVVECDTSADAAEMLESLIKEGDVVLIKGSQSMRMERVVKALMKEPKRAKELLVRHDAEWLLRP